MSSPPAELRLRIESLIQGAFGRVEEDLVGSGIVDSLRAMELLTLLQHEFKIPLTDMGMDRLSTVTAIVDFMHEALSAR